MKLSWVGAGRAKVKAFKLGVSVKFNLGYNKASSFNFETNKRRQEWELSSRNPAAMRS